MQLGSGCRRQPSWSGELLPEREVRRRPQAEVDLGKLQPSVLRVEAPSLARAALGGQHCAVVALAAQELREQPGADAAALVGGAHVELDDLEVRRVEPLGALSIG